VYVQLSGIVVICKQFVSPIQNYTRPENVLVYDAGSNFEPFEGCIISFMVAANILC
jgi:hypothetical protein